TRMPTPKEILNSHTGPFAVPGGERFVVKYFRPSYRNLRNKSSVINSIPRPGLAINLVWNWLVLLDAVHSRLNQAEGQLAREALRCWWQAIYPTTTATSASSSLSQLLMVADKAWEDPKGIAA